MFMRIGSEVIKEGFQENSGYKLWPPRLPRIKLTPLIFKNLLEVTFAELSDSRPTSTPPVDFTC